MSEAPANSASRHGQNSRLAAEAWTVAALAAAAISVSAGVAPGHAAIGASLCLIPALLGFALTPALRQEWVQVLLVCAWTALALGAAFALGATSGAACWFLLPPIVAFTLGRRSLILETGVTSLLGLGLATALEAGGLAPPLYPAAENPVLSVLAVAMAVVFATAVAASARRQAMLERAALRRRTQAFDQFSERMPAAVLRLDTAGVITGAAGAVKRTLGREGGAVTGKPLSALTSNPNAASAVTAALDEARRNGGESMLELTLTTGAVVELRLTAAMDGATALAIDVTERVRRERAMLTERDAAMAASEAKSRFLASMSHEIRTPLNAIIGFSDVMKQRLFGPMPARYAEYGDLIHESGRHLLDLVGDVLDMSKIEADRYDLKLESLDVRDLAASAVKLMRLRAEEAGVGLELDCGLAPLPVRADRKALRQILLNLLSNALKFTPKGGHVRLSLRSEGGELVLEIADTGAGMSQEDVRKVGQPYQQGGSAIGSSERGTGLGLALVAALANLHGGALEIESVLGKGTTARVRLPVLDSAPAPVRLDARARLQRAAVAGEEIRKAQIEAQA